MFHTPWEMDHQIRHHAADIAADRLAVSPIAGSPARPTRLRRAFGMVLIRVGERLAERDAIATGRVSRPVTAGRVGS